MKKFMQLTTVAALSLALAGTTVAQTQAQTPPSDSPKSDPKNCASKGSSGDLSSNLRQSGGVICPPDVDQGMKAPTPNTGKMPVIPPPGSPGGNPNVQPK
jgi:hypothetical protein